MRVHLNPYSEYKEPNLHWLEKIPKHWEEKSAKYFFREVDERSSTGEEELLSVSHTTGVTPRSQKTVTMFKPETYVGHKLCRPGDLVINTMWAWMSALGVAEETGIVSPAYGVYRPIDPRAFIPAYLDLLLRTQPYQSEYRCRSTGIRASRLRLYPEKFLQIPIACPPREEQERILTFLSIKIRRIQSLINTSLRLVDLLNEQKQALIHRIVTGQIDVRTGRPHESYKPSNVEWFEKIPTHWEVRRIKHVVKLRSGESITSESIEPKGEYAVYGGNGLRGFTSAYTHEGEFVLIGRQGALCGNINYARGKFWASEHAVVAHPIEPFESLWLGELLRAMNLNQYSIAAAQPGLAVERIANLSIPVPNMPEQQAIARFFSAHFGSFDTAISCQLRKVEMIREYRTRLIADVVTGNLDVRHLKLPTYTGSFEAGTLEALHEGEFDEAEWEAIPEEALDAVD